MAKISTASGSAGQAGVAVGSSDDGVSTGVVEVLLCQHTQQQESGGPQPLPVCKEMLQEMRNTYSRSQR